MCFGDALCDWWIGGGCLCQSAQSKNVTNIGDREKKERSERWRMRVQNVDVKEYKWERNDSEERKRSQARKVKVFGVGLVSSCLPLTWPSPAPAFSTPQRDYVDRIGRVKRCATLGCESQSAMSLGVGRFIPQQGDVKDIYRVTALCQYLTRL